MDRKALRRKTPDVLLTVISLTLATIFHGKAVIAAAAVLLVGYFAAAYGTELFDRKARLAWAASGWTTAFLLLVAWTVTTFGSPTVTLTLMRLDVGDATSCTTCPLGNDRLPTGSTALFTARVQNAGPPTIVNYGSDLAIHFPSGETATGKAHIVPRGIYITNSRTGQATGYSGEDALTEKTVETPVPTGGQVTGVLFFWIPDVDYKSVMTPGTVFTVSYQDITGTIRKASLHWKAKEMTPDEIDSRLPGLHAAPTR